MPISGTTQKSYEYKSIDMSIASPVQDQWYTIADLSGNLVINSVSGYRRDDSGQPKVVEFEILVDEISFTGLYEVDNDRWYYLAGGFANGAMSFFYNWVVFGYFSSVHCSRFRLRARHVSAVSENAVFRVSVYYSVR